MEGEIVTVTEILDDGWCSGVTEDGKEGIFPEGFVSYINDSVDQLDTTSAVDHSTIATNIESYTEEEPAPNYYDLFPQFKLAASDQTTNTTSNCKLSSLDVKPYAITLYPFNAQFPNELSFCTGEVVHLVKHIDSEWMEGMIDDHKGIFPISYVDIIVDCNETDGEQNYFNQDTSTTDYDELTAGTQAKVEYTFKAQMDGDLSVIEGDTVTVINMANADWVNVEDQSGKTGLCPRGYLTALHIESSDTTQSSLEDFVIIRRDETSDTEADEQKAKRLSEPHRPAPPVPAPGRIPLQKDVIENKATVLESVNQQIDVANNNNLDVKQKRADQRQNVISELVMTEKEYVRDLKLTYETFNLHNPSKLESLGIDVTTLFGNIFEVIQVAEELLDMMLRAMKGCDEELQTVGPCFTKMAEKLKNVYVKYCGNHEAALFLLKKVVLYMELYISILFDMSHT